MARERLKPGTAGTFTYTPMLKVKGGKPQTLTVSGKRYLTKDGGAVQPDQWKATAYVRDKDGQRRKVEAVGGTKSEADQALKGKLEDRHTPTTADIKPTTTTGELADLWHAHVVKADQLSYEALKLYTITMEKHVKPGSLSALQVREVTAGSVHDFLAGLIDPKTGKGRGTAKTARTVLRGMFELAVRNDAVKVNPVRQAERVSAPAKTVRKLEATKKGHLEPGEVTKVLAAASAETFARRDVADLLHFLSGTGVRIGEALAAKWEDIDLEAGTIEVGGKTVVRRKGQGLVIEEHGRTKSFDRTMKLPASLVSRLLERRVNQGENPLGLVFPSPRYGTRGGDTLRDVVNTTKDVRRVFEAAGVELPKGQGSHLFRHTVATVLLQSGVPIRDVSNQLGHVATKTTTDLYASRKTVASAAADLLG